MRAAYRSDGRGGLVFDGAALASSAQAYRRLGLTAARVAKIAKQYADEQLPDTAAWLAAVAETMRQQGAAQARRKYNMAQKEAAQNAPETTPMPPWGGGHRPFVHLRVDGPDGNVFAQIGRCQRMAAAAGKTAHDIQIFTAEVMGMHSNRAAKAVMERWFQVTWEDLS